MANGEHEVKINNLEDDMKEVKSDVKDIKRNVSEIKASVNTRLTKNENDIAWLKNIGKFIFGSIIVSILVTIFIKSVLPAIGL